MDNIQSYIETHKSHRITLQLQLFDNGWIVKTIIQTPDGVDLPPMEDDDCYLDLDAAIASGLREARAYIDRNSGSEENT